jgi:hypothetical protein
MRIEPSPGAFARMEAHMKPAMRFGPAFFFGSIIATLFLLPLSGSVSVGAGLPVTSEVRAAPVASSLAEDGPVVAARSEETGALLIGGPHPRMVLPSGEVFKLISPLVGNCYYIDSVSVIIPPNLPKPNKDCGDPSVYHPYLSVGRWEYFICKNGNCNTPQAGCRVKLKVRAVQFEGGHSHDANRPTGAPSDTLGDTGLDGERFRIIHRWPQVGGALAIYFWALDDSCGGSAGTDSTTIDWVYCLEAAPLAPSPELSRINIPPISFPALGGGADYDTVGQTGSHPDNHYGLQAMVDSLVPLAHAFRVRFPSGPKVAYNDMSLIYGGVFDTHQNWQSPGHCGHRVGMEVDFKTTHLGPTPALPLSSKYLRYALKAIKERKFSVHPELNPPHWHLKYYGHGTFRGPGSTLTTEPVVP